MRELLRSFKSYLQQQLEFGEEEILLPVKNKLERLAILRARVETCTLCPLSQARKNMVFGEGNENCSIAFVGEAPGREEDERGLPFVGLAGQLLTRAIEAIGMQRKDVYIANIIKCRPPNNRVPRESEIASCLPYLLEQLSIIRPSVIGLLGAVATQSLLKVHAPMFKLRGKVLRHSGMTLLPTYHPAALLRNPNLKKSFWEDMKLLSSTLESVKQARPDG